MYSPHSTAPSYVFRDDLHSSDQWSQSAALSPFQQTQREAEERFYSTFPQARLAAVQQDDLPPYADTLYLAPAIAESIIARDPLQENHITPSANPQYTDLEVKRGNSAMYPAVVAPGYHVGAAPTTANPGIDTHACTFLPQSAIQQSSQSHIACHSHQADASRGSITLDAYQLPPHPQPFQSMSMGTYAPPVKMEPIMDFLPSPESPFSSTKHMAVKTAPVVYPGRCDPGSSTMVDRPLYFYKNQTESWQEKYAQQHGSWDEYPRSSSSSSGDSSPSSAAQSRNPPLPVSTSRKTEKKQVTLSCYFCRARKIACGPPAADNPDRSCNQCNRRSLKCEYPLESRRGMRKKKKVPPRLEEAAP